MTTKNQFQYPTSDGARALIVAGDEAVADNVIKQVADYFGARNIEFHCDYAASIQDSLLQLKYYDYDVAIASMRQSNGESGADFMELVRKRKYDFPVILFGEESERGAAMKLAENGVVGYFVMRGKEVDVTPGTVDHGVLIFRTICAQANLNQDLVEKNRELKAVNELLARQSVRLLKMRKEQESQRRTLESLLHSMSDAVVFINSRGKIDMTNPAARRAFKILEGTKFELEDLKALTGVNPLEAAPGVETPLLLLSRNYKMISSEVEFEGERMGRILVMHDVTRDVEMEKVKAEFQSMISHELRTPLTAIKGAVENFLRGVLGDVTDQQKTFLEMIMRNVDRQAELVNGILDLAKLDAKMMTPRKAMVDPVYIVRLTFETFQYVCQEKGIKLQMDLPPEIPKVYADATMLTQIMDNILSNAVKFTPKGGRIVVKVFKAVSEDGEDSVAFSVADSGIGVPEHLRERIFESYFQADSGMQRQYKGTGLGLSISRQMAELHNGTLRCQSAPNGGSLFVLTIPLNTSRRKKVFLMSEPEHAAMDGEILGREFNVVKPDGSASVMENILHAAPRLFVMDFNPKIADTMKVFSMIKQSQQTAGIPVIFMGRDLTEKEKVLLLKMGADDVIARPYTAGEFLARVKKVMGEEI